ncbi:AAA domain-containing protein, partial [Vararia minispora EC-137]
TVYVVGPSSTGKTTLCNALAAQLGLLHEVYVTEVARTVMREHAFTREEVHTQAMQEAIAHAHVAREKEARRVAAEHGSLVLCDRCALDAVVYGMLNSEAQGQILMDIPTIRGALEDYRSAWAHVVLLAPVADWMVDDGVRSMQDGETCVEMYRLLLRELRIAYLEVGEDCRPLEDRV